MLECTFRLRAKPNKLRIAVKNSLCWPEHDIPIERVYGVFTRWTRKLDLAHQSSIELRRRRPATLLPTSRRRTCRLARRRCVTCSSSTRTLARTKATNGSASCAAFTRRTSAWRAGSSARSIRRRRREVDDSTVSSGTARSHLLTLRLLPVRLAGVSAEAL